MWLEVSGWNQKKPEPSTSSAPPSSSSSSSLSPGNNNGLAALMAGKQTGRHPIPVIGSEIDRPDGTTIFAKDQDVFEFAGLKIRVLECAGHTKGHVAFDISSTQASSEEPSHLFTGDALFVAGCGRVFEGTCATMYNSLQRLVNSVPDSTFVWPGHEYAFENLHFAASVDPNNFRVNVLLSSVKSQGQPATVRRRRKASTSRSISSSTHYHRRFLFGPVDDDSDDDDLSENNYFAFDWSLPRQCHVPSTISQEKLINPFLRCHQPTFHALARLNNDTAKPHHNRLDSALALRSRAPSPRFASPQAAEPVSRSAEEPTRATGATTPSLSNGGSEEDALISPVHVFTVLRNLKDKFRAHL
eukprot:m.27398 g.27398  ORF g.27398 m.27398 type:complete len:358 (-) comp13941_c0_seq1:97-1170(-)